VSLQVAILKVLASYPDGKASLAALKGDLAILAGAGIAWSERLKRLGAQVPDLDIFGQDLVLRDDTGWQLPAAGRELLSSIEVPLTATGATVPTATLGVVPPVAVERPRPPKRTRGRRWGQRHAAALKRSA
jgi:hypothetical protein